MKTLVLLIATAVLGCSSQHSATTSVDSSPGMAHAEFLTQDGKYPAQRSVVLLRMINKTITRGHLCGAVLIGNRTVLTAAHCLESLGKYGNDGVEILFDFKSRDSVHRLKVKEIEIHPQYKTGGYIFTYISPKFSAPITVTHQRRFDFALLSFDGAIPAGFMPALIDQDPSADLSGQTVIAYGAGATGNMIDVKNNADVLRLMAGKLSRGSFVVQSKEFSGEDFYMIEGSTSERICNGDSGGPQFLLSAAQPTVVGINSARFSEIDLMNKEVCGPASLAAKVSSAAKWILETKEKFEKN